MAFHLKYKDADDDDMTILKMEWSKVLFRQIKT